VAFTVTSATCALRELLVEAGWSGAPMGPVTVYYTQPVIDNAATSVAARRRVFNTQYPYK
jgi:8-oxo-dGTP pyrophosphatase MutT (NUDIX family)